MSTIEADRKRLRSIPHIKPWYDSQVATATPVVFRWLKRARDRTFSNVWPLTYRCEHDRRLDRRTMADRYLVTPSAS